MPESLDRDAAKDHKESLAMNAKCEVDTLFGEHVRFESKKNRKARILCVF